MLNKPAQSWNGNQRHFEVPASPEITAVTGPWCARLKGLLCAPSVVSISVNNVKTETPGLNFQGRTCVSSWHCVCVCVCDIWGTAQLQANNILISFSGLNVFSGVCSRWHHPTRLLNYSSTLSERESPGSVHSWGGKERHRWQAKRAINETKVRD